MDFTLFNSILSSLETWLLILFSFWWVFPIVLLFFYFRKKYTDDDIFWINLITWEFWSWKSYNLALNSYDYNKSWLFIIWNNPNSFVNIFYNSLSDLEKVFNFILLYTKLTNQKEFLNFKFRPIVFNIDEAHNYFFSRSFKANITKEKLLVLTQLRKRSILVNFITQELWQLDIFIRRLTPIVIRYYSFIWFLRRWKMFYLPNPEDINLNDETKVEKIKSWFYLAPSFLLFLSKKRRNMLNEKWVSKFVVWFDDKISNLDFEWFLLEIYPLNTSFWQDFWRIYKKVYWDKDLSSYNC